MRFRVVLVVLAFLIAGQAHAACSGMPWKFGMTVDEVTAVTECGPYKSFENGDVETYEGVFDGKKQNFQFFFQEGKLRRIGIYLYEGQDASEGSRVWLSLYHSLSKMFGDVETPANVTPNSEENSASFMAEAQEIVQGPGKTQMAPVQQPNDARVFSSFRRIEAQGQTYYNVVLYFDSP